jgi:hypothetical protein
MADVAALGADRWRFRAAILLLLLLLIRIHLRLGRLRLGTQEVLSRLCGHWSWKWPCPLQLKHVWNGFAALGSRQSKERCPSWLQL